MKYIQNSDARMKSMETQISQLATLLSERAPGTLPGTTEPNPKEHAKAITLRSGKEIGEASQEKDKPLKNNEDTLEEPIPMEKKKVNETLLGPSSKKHEPSIPFPQRLKNT